MARILLLLLSFIVAFAAQAQGVVRQQGYVRSVGRPDNKAGKRLPGAVIKVSGQHNTVRSGQNGKFTLEFNGLREGKDSYSFASVRLAGYDLPENGMLGHRYPLSSTVPVEVVLVPQALKMEIEEKVRHTVETQYRKKLQRIEALRAKDVERYRTELQRLEAEYEKRDQLITDMVERYASTDYAHLDSLSARINQYIEAGELERADSLINAQDISRLESEHAALQARTDQLRSDLAQSESASAASIRQLMSLYEGKRNIHIARFENDSAAMYCEKIVQLDTTNVKNVLGAGWFISEFIADYNKAMNLFQMALRNALRIYGEDHEYVAVSYSYIGSVYVELCEYSKAMEFCVRNLSISEKLYGACHQEVATCYNNIGSVYKVQGEYTKAMENQAKALSIWKKLYGENHPNVALGYNNIGSIYQDKGEYSKAMEYYIRALSILEKLYGVCHQDVATSYNNIGSIYKAIGEYTKAMENHTKALSIWKKLYGENHPKVALGYYNVGAVYQAQGEYVHAMENYAKALSIRLGIYGENHSDVAACYNNIGSVYKDKGDYSQAMECFVKSLSIFLKVNGENHSSVATCYANIGTIYYNQKDYSKAMEYYEKSLSIFLNTYGENHPSVATCYVNIGSIYYFQKDYSKAMEYYVKSLSIDLGIYGEDHPKVANSYRNIGSVYNKLGNYSKAIDYHTKSLSIFLKNYGENKLDVAILYGNIAWAYEEQDLYVQAVDNFEKSMLIKQGIGCDYANELSHIYLCYSKCYTQSPQEWQSQYESFITSHMAIATVVPNGAAAQKGLEGTYYMLEFGDWQAGSTSNFYDEKDRLAGKPKTVVFYRDGKFIKEHFDDQIGVRLGVKSVDKAERKAIIEAWKKWRGE